MYSSRKHFKFALNLKTHFTINIWLNPMFDWFPITTSSFILCFAHSLDIGVKH